MAIIRIALLLVVLGGLTLLLAQNWLPVLPLVFLGMSTQALPLAVWILLSLAAGAFSSLLITGLFKLSNYFAQPQLKSGKGSAFGFSGAPRQSAGGSNSSTSGSTFQEKRRNGAEDSSAQPNQAQYSTANRTASNTDSTPSDASDDWDSTTDDDWDFEEDADKTQKSSSQDDVRSTTYEVKQEPKSGYRSGSVYSYSYQEPKNSGVGKTESVYDADYRVITPPYRETNTAKNDEDWGFEDDDKFEDEDERDSPTKER